MPRLTAHGAALRCRTGAVVLVGILLTTSITGAVAARPPSSGVGVTSRPMLQPVVPLPRPGWRVDDPTVTDYLIIGSSMSSILASRAGEEAYALLSRRHSFFLDARGCRTLIGPSCSIGDRPAPPNTIEALRSHAGTFDKALVVVAGANDQSEGEFGMRAAIDTILDETARQGIRWVVWLNYNEDSSVGVRMRRHNTILRAAAAEEPRLVLADWNERVSTLPDGWFTADGIHIGPAAAIELADLIADTLDLVEMTGPGDTLCSLSSTPRRAAGATWATSTNDIRSSRASARAVRLQARCPT